VTLNCVGETKVIASGRPSKVAVDVFMNDEPLIVKLVVPAASAGLTPVTTGAAFKSVTVEEELALGSVALAALICTTFGAGKTEGGA
jgi:hypothetical protein